MLDLAVEEEPRLWGVIVPGDPMPMPRARGRIAGKPPRQFVSFYTPKEADTHKAAVASAWRQARHGAWAEHVSLLMVCRFVFPRPTGHYGTGRNASTVKPQHLSARPRSSAASHEGRRYGGDVDNLAKLVLDALTGVAYADDGDVVCLEAEKLYVDQANVAEPQTYVALRAL